MLHLSLEKANFEFGKYKNKKNATSKWHSLANI